MDAAGGPAMAPVGMSTPQSSRRGRRTLVPAQQPGPSSASSARRRSRFGSTLSTADPRVSPRLSRRSTDGRNAGGKKRLDELKRDALQPETVGLLSEFTGGGDNPVDCALAGQQSWTAELPAEQVGELRGWLDGVDPVAFFSGDPSAQPFEPTSATAERAPRSAGAASAPAGAAPDAPRAHEWRPSDHKTLPNRPAKDPRCTLQAEPLADDLTLSMKQNSVVCAQGEREWKTHRRNTLIELSQTAGFGADDQAALMEDGHYVGSHPSRRHMNLRNHEAVVARTTRDPESGRLWLRTDGDLKHLPDPLVDQPLRLPLTGVHAQLVGFQQIRDSRVRFQHPRRAPESLTRRSMYTVSLHVSKIRFEEHFLFTDEHRVALALEDLWRVYQARTADGKVALLTHRLAALKEAKTSLQKRLVESGVLHSGGVSHADETSQRLRPRLAEYQRDIVETRLARDTEQAIDVKLVPDIIDKWNELKSARRRQRFTSTRHLLRVVEEKEDKNTDLRAYERDLADELEERREVYAQRQERMQRAYREKLAQEIHRMESDPAVDPMEVHKIDPDALPAHLMIPFDEANTHDEIVRRLRECRRAPGRPTRIPIYSTDGDRNSDDQVTREELDRRVRVRQCRYVITTIVNGRAAHCTEPIALDDDFTLSTEHLTKLYLHEVPRDIVLQVAEAKGGWFKARHSVDVPIPIGAEGVKTESDRKMTEFQYDRRVHHPTIGSASASAQSVRGHVQCWATWESMSAAESLDGARALPTGRAEDRSAVAALGADGVRDLEQLKEWAASNKLDPNDPRNAHLIARLKHAGQGVEATFYRLRCRDEVGELKSEPGVEPLPGEIEPSQRERLIRLRAEEAMGYRELIVPLREDEIKEKMFDRNEAQKRADLVLLAGFGGGADDEPEFRISEHAQFLRTIRNAQLKKQRSIRQVPQLGEVVQETHLLPQSSGIGAWIREHLGGTGGGARPLKPPRRQRTAVAPAAEDLMKETRTLRIQIGRATNLPRRSSPGGNHSIVKGVGDTVNRSQMMPIGAIDSSPRRSMAAGVATPAPGLTAIEDVDLQPFIEVVFQGHAGVTPVGTGRDPVWNFNFEMDFVPPNNSFSQESLQSCTDEIVFHVYDQRYVDVLRDEEKRGDVIHMRRQRRWLGSLAIPVRTIYSQIDPLAKCKVDGTFKINVPFALVGYDQTPGRGRQRTGSYLSVLLTISPSLPAPESAVVIRDTIEEARLIAYAKHWKDSLMLHHPHNYVMPTCQDIHGTTVLICRYVHRQQPPTSVCDPTTVTLANITDSMRRLARFVSMIPEKQDSSIFVGFCNLWATSSQFLQMMGGDDEEHAILLCNYFLSLPGFKSTGDRPPENEAYVVLGRGIPRGNSIYVLTRHRVASPGAVVDGPAVEGPGAHPLPGDKHGFARLFWDPMTGQSFSVNDSFCPLKHVDCIFNEVNIWANIQKANKNPREKSIAAATTTQYDVTKGGWKPFFTRSFPRPELTSYQIENLVYRNTRADHTKLLQSELQRRLRGAFQKWRPRHFTAWSRSCQKRLEEVLPLFEEAWVDSACGRTAKLEEVYGALHEVSERYSLVGIPLNFPFTTYSDALSRVFNTNLHEVADDNIEFSIAVHVHSYPNDVFSVWVYVGTSETMQGGGAERSFGASMMGPLTPGRDDPSRSSFAAMTIGSMSDGPTSGRRRSRFAPSLP